MEKSIFVIYSDKRDGLGKVQLHNAITENNSIRGLNAAQTGKVFAKHVVDEFGKPLLEHYAKVHSESLLEVLASFQKTRPVTSRDIPALLKTLTVDQNRTFLKQLSERYHQFGKYSLKTEQVYLLEELTETSRKFQKVKFYTGDFSLFAKAILSPSDIELALYIKAGSDIIPVSECFPVNPVTVKYKNQLFVFKNVNDCLLYKEYSSGRGVKKFAYTQVSQVYHSLIPELRKQVPVEVDPCLEPQEMNISSFEKKIVFSELNETFLLVKPLFVYNGIERDHDGNTQLHEVSDNRHIVIKRNTEDEKAFMHLVRNSHPSFTTQNSYFFYLRFEDVLNKNWFFHFHAQMKSLDVQVLGIDKLKKLKYNTNKAEIRISFGEAIDWLDLNLKVYFGDQVIGMRDIKQAVSNGQTHVLLDDGSLGIIPPEWAEKLNLLLQLGKTKDDNLQLSKYHIHLLQDLVTDTADAALVNELEERKKRLANIESIKDVSVPEDIKATLRPYQAEGFKWLTKLDQLGLGGCLADDMGLGKTLQTISFLQYRIKQDKGSCHLIVSPSSLIYNWESELRKFAPDIPFRIHHGQERAESLPEITDAQVIITSYSTLRNDLELFKTRKFGYIVLDESQSIKNPSAKVSRAAQELKSNNRLILSGTPFQNSTFDLYSQFNFLNPGMLGSQETFRREFAHPIDRSGDAGKIEKLRKLLYPFMLRRTKEEVAKDLPAKTETVIFCEMSREQRAIYEERRDYFRDLITAKIDTEGLQKSGILIIQALTQLRQICNSPSLVSEQPDAAPSAKLEELLREIEENTSSHKLLIFSQFTGMLDLIGSALTEREIHHVKLTGSTPAKQRQEMVEKFEQDPQLKVFLISLKAGGVGLNLTAADYVYLVDPWWNPAVEQQAIDRAHRIGQDKKVFAYKLICRDSVEEKILQLQSRKKELAQGLIQDDDGFGKHLSLEDIQYLFD